MISFGSDNHAGAHPEILLALERANSGTELPYGFDSYSERALSRFRAEFNDSSLDLLWAFSGTGANVLALAALLSPGEAVLCADASHIHQDEAGAPECLAGAKLLTLPSRDGKISPESAKHYLAWAGDHHRAQPKVVSLTQCTEFGTVYSLEELRAWRDFARERGLKIHVDGARIANALVAIGCGWKDFFEASGADAISFGGTKNGLLLGEAVLLRRGASPHELRGLQKRFLQQSSKARFLAAQFLAYFDLWQANASAANASAKILSGILAEFPAIRITRPVETNAVFAVIPPPWRVELLKQFKFYVWDSLSGECRLMCSFATKPEELEAFRVALRNLSAH